MNPIVYVNTDISKAYYEEGFLRRLKDRLRINLEGESFIKELDLTIAHINLPPNFNKNAYMNNITITKKVMKKRNPALAPKTWRYLDYTLLSDFQKRLFAYGVVNSVKLLLRTKNKSLRTSCIVVYDAADEVNYNIILELAKACKYLILLSDNIVKTTAISEYIVSSYGVSPIVTTDYAYAALKSDFIISSKDIEVDKPIWYINNMYIPKGGEALAVNDISFAVPWDVKNLEFSFELLGAILGQMQEKDIELSLKYNGIYLDKIKFNESVKI